MPVPSERTMFGPAARSVSGTSFFGVSSAGAASGGTTSRPAAGVACRGVVDGGERVDDGRRRERRAAASVLHCSRT